MGKKLEPSVYETLGKEVPAELAINYSIAISLKRIADAVETIASADSEQLCDFIEAIVKGLKDRNID